MALTCLPLSLSKGLDSVALRFCGESDCGSQFFFLPQNFLFFYGNLFLSFYDFDFDFFVADLLFFFGSLKFVSKLCIRSLRQWREQEVKHSQQNVTTTTLTPPPPPTYRCVDFLIERRLLELILPFTDKEEKVTAES